MKSMYAWATNLCDAVWYLISKWRISDERPGLWQKATCPRHQLLKTIRIPLMIAALNDLEVKLGNIFNAYLQGKGQRESVDYFRY